MSLRQFISARYLLRTFRLVDDAIDTVTDTVTDGWKEVARMFGLHEDLFANPLHRKLSKPVTAILIGAGHRGCIYADYAVKNPDELNIVGVADLNHLRVSKTPSNIISSNIIAFIAGKIFLKKKSLRMPIIIATPDKMHTAPCLRALEMGYDVLLEKPIAPTEDGMPEDL